MYYFIFNYLKNNFYMMKNVFKMAKETIFYQYATWHVSIYDFLAYPARWKHSFWNIQSSSAIFLIYIYRGHFNSA